MGIDDKLCFTDYLFELLKTFLNYQDNFKLKVKLYVLHTC